MQQDILMENFNPDKVLLRWIYHHRGREF